MQSQQNTGMEIGIIYEEQLLAIERNHVLKIVFINKKPGGFAPGFFLSANGFFKYYVIKIIARIHVFGFSFKAKEWFA
jgi:hypothetical protein